MGYELKKKAICFGGDVLTTTDIIVADGFAMEGANRDLVAHLT